LKWSDTDISFGHEDHLETKLSNRNLPFVVKLSIGRHTVAKTLIDNEASLNLIMRKTFIEMGLNLADLTPIHNTFHCVISGQSSTFIGHIDHEVSCGSGDNKRREMVTFDVASFDIGYNKILGRPFLLKFMMVIHTAYATMKMPRPKGVITIKADPWDALTCENALLSHAGCFGNKAAQDQAAKTSKTQGGNTPHRTPMPKPPTSSTSRASTAQKGTYVASSSTQPPTDQKVDYKQKGNAGEEHKEILADPNNPNKKLRISSNSFVLALIGCFCMENIGNVQDSQGGD
jgi:hypothetical protein